MPRPVPERALSERWIDELAVLRHGGEVHRVPARTRVCREQVPRTTSDPLFPVEMVLHILQIGIVMYLVDKVFGRWTEPPMQDTHAEVALYAPGVRPGDLPRVVIDAPVRLAALVDAQGGEVDVRGEIVPGHGIVLVLDDGEVVPCTYPAEPPPPVFAKRLWGYRG